MAQVYRIKDWMRHYENNRTKDLKYMNWVPIPNSHDGEGYCQMVEGDDGAEILGAWLACVQVASRCDPRGTLLRKSRTPHDAASLATRTRLKVDAFKKMLERATRPSVDWMELIEVADLEENTTKNPVKVQMSQAHAGIPQGVADTRARARATEGTEGTERNGRKTSPSAKRARDPVWDAVVDIWFGGTTLAGDAKRIGSIVKRLKLNNATPQDIKSRVKNYRDAWPDCECTPEAMVKHWSRFAKSNKTVVDGVEWTDRGTPEQNAAILGQSVEDYLKFHPEEVRRVG